MQTTVFAIHSSHFGRHVHVVMIQSMHVQFLFSTKCDICEDVDNSSFKEASLVYIHRQVLKQLQFKELPQHDIHKNHKLKQRRSDLP